MEGQSVVVIHDASSREVNVKIFEWSLRALSLAPGAMLTLVAVMYQVITPMGYTSSVDSRLMFGANQKMIEAQAARKKEEYLNNPELAQIFKLYKSEKAVNQQVFVQITPDQKYNSPNPTAHYVPFKTRDHYQRTREENYEHLTVGFVIEMATGLSLKAVALKSAIKLKATWLILDRKMKNDEDYFLRKLSCGILRVKRFNKIIRLRGLQHQQETRPGSTHETFTDSIPLSYTSTDHDLDPSIENYTPNSTTTNTAMIGQGTDNQMNQEKEETRERECLTPPDQLSKEEKGIFCKKLESQTQRDLHWKDKEQKERRDHVKEEEPKLKHKLEEKNCDITCGGSKGETQQRSLTTEVYEQGERCSSFGGARNFYLGRAEEYTVSEQFFSLSNFHVRN